MRKLFELPPEIILLIMGFLDPKDLLLVMKVCKLGNQLANENFLWFRFFAGNQQAVIFSPKDNYKKLWFEVFKIVAPLRKYFAGCTLVATTQLEAYRHLFNTIISSENWRYFFASPLAALNEPANKVLMGLVTFQLKYMENEWQRSRCMNPDAFVDYGNLPRGTLYELLTECQNQINHQHDFSEMDSLQTLKDFVTTIPAAELNLPNNLYYKTKEQFLDAITGCIQMELAYTDFRFARW